ncbi:hypothetical protein [Noviherbaspirillum agri]
MMTSASLDLMARRAIAPFRESRDARQRAATALDSIKQRSEADVQARTEHGPRAGRQEKG